MNLEFVGGPLDGKADYATPDGQREFHLAVWVPEPIRKLEPGEAAVPCRRIVHRYQMVLVLQEVCVLLLFLSRPRPTSRDVSVL